MAILILILLTLLNGLFSMSEIAVVSSRKFKLENAAKRGKASARLALELAESPSRFLSTVQIGITLISIIVGLYSGETLSEPLQHQIEGAFPALAPFSKNISMVLVVLFTTYLSIVLGELFPKRIGMSFPETVAMLVAAPMALLSKIASPFVWLLTTSNDLLLRVFRINARTDSIVTEEEIKSMISESTESGEIQEIEQDIVERVFALGDRKVSSLMTHRSDILWLDLKDTPDQIRAKIGEEIHGVYPVAEDDLDNMVGVVSVKDLFLKMHAPDFTLEDCLQTPVYTPDSSSAYKLLDDFRKHRFHYGVVVDEFGTIQGIITMDDLLDALVGDVSTRNQEEYSIIAQADHSWIADGQYPFFEMLRYFEIEDQEYTDADFNTVAGFMITKLDSMPKTGDQLEWHKYHFEVTAMNGRRIESIRIKRL
jgi:putative hemolysin